MKGKVSIIIPLYNREGLILETLKSLFNQSHDNWEAIIVDDQSSDASFEVVQQEAKKDVRIKALRRESDPKGAPRCRNIGIEKASGEYILFLDSDDLLAPYCLEERLDYFDSHETDDFLVFNSSFFKDAMGDTPVLWNKFSEENDLNRFLRGDTVWCISSAIWKRESILKNELRFIESAKSSQDWEFHVKALHKEMSYSKIDDLPDFFVRRNPQQSTNAISSGHSKFDKFLNRIQLYKKMFDEYQLTIPQSKLLFNNINSEVFNNYHKLTLTELKLLWRNIRAIKCFETSKIDRYANWYVLLSISSRLTFNKSHHIVHYYKRFRAKNELVSGYRSVMSDQMFKLLNQKLDASKSITA